MAKAAKRLEKLEEQRARINAEIQRVRAKEQQQKRKEETRRKVLVGSLIMGKVQSGEWPEEELIETMDSYLERDNDRALFGLPPKQQKPHQQQQPQQKPQPQQQPERIPTAPTIREAIESARDKGR